MSSKLWFNLFWLEIIWSVLEIKNVSQEVKIMFSFTSQFKTYSIVLSMTNIFFRL